MKKLLLLALVAAPLVMSAQDAPKAEFESLTTNWTVNEGIPAIGDGRQAAFANGKCYIQNKVTQSLVVVDENGAVAQSDMATSTHAGITRDDAGNVIVNMSSNFPMPFTNIMDGEDVVGAKAELRIFPADGGAPVDVEFNIPSSFANTRSDFLSKAYGNVLDPEEGGGMFFIDNGASGILDVYFVGGEPLVEDIMVHNVADGAPALKSNANQSLADVFYDADENFMILNYIRGDNPNIYEFLDDGTLAGKTVNTVSINDDTGNKVTGRTNMHGVTAFALGGFNFLLIPTGPAAGTYADEFSIVQLTDDGYNYICTKEATVANGTLSGGGICAEWFEVVPVGDVTAHIYQFAGGSFVSKHTLRIKATVTGIDNISTAKTVTAVKYYNAQGIESDTPFDGFNIEVSLYNDGTRKASKLLK